MNQTQGRSHTRQCRMKIKARFFLFLVAMAFLSGFAGCPPTQEEVCLIKIPEFRAGLEGVPYGGTEEDETLTLDEKKQWGQWARHWVEKLQLALDIISPQENPAERRYLTRILNDLVVFHGHVDQNDVERMRRLADEIAFDLDQFEQLYCFGGPNPDQPLKMDAIPVPSPSPSRSVSPKKKSRPRAKEKSSQ